MAAKPTAGSLPDDVVQRIRDSVIAGRGKSMFREPGEPMPLFGAQCRCGINRKPAGLAKHVEDDGLCIVHPEKPPQPWVRGAGHGKSAGEADT